MCPNSPPRLVNELSLAASRPRGRGGPGRLDELLASGVNPNVQPEKAEELIHEVGLDWASQDPPPQFNSCKQWQPPLYCAAIVGGKQVDRDESIQMVTSLLQHGAEPFLEFPQALYHPPGHCHPRAPFPGEDAPRNAIPDVSTDVSWDEFEPYNSDKDSIDEHEPPQWGIRHVLHAVLEDGGRFKPFMEYPGFLESLDVEHRDPQGRTLLLSACRSSHGADARVESAYRDASLNLRYGGFFDNDAYPEWDRDRGPTQSDYAQPTTETVVDVLLRLGADPLAVDSQGKNSLHHLLVEVSNNQNVHFNRLPVVRRTLRILCSRYPSLVNQPDQHGVYPLHAALRRMRFHTSSDFIIQLAEPLGCVAELLRAGANPRAKDRKGNTALHYLADDDLTGIWYRTERRQMFYELLDTHGCREDINLPNNAGKTVAELIFDDNGRGEDIEDTTYDFNRNAEQNQDLCEWKEADEEVFRKLDEAGIDWKARASDGGTLLHLVARSGLEWERLLWRSQFLMRKGVDLKATDAEGRTARELAIECELNKKYFYRALEDLENDETKE